jgi:hypothetical protein
VDSDDEADQHAWQRGMTDANIFSDKPICHLHL